MRAHSRSEMVATRAAWVLLRIVRRGVGGGRRNAVHVGQSASYVARMVEIAIRKLADLRRTSGLFDVLAKARKQRALGVNSQRAEEQLTGSKGARVWSWAMSSKQRGRSLAQPSLTARSATFTRPDAHAPLPHLPRHENTTPTHEAEKAGPPSQCPSRTRTPPSRR